MAHIPYASYGAIDLTDPPPSPTGRRRSRSASPPAPGTQQMQERTRSPPRSDLTRRGHSHSRASSLSAPRYNHLTLHGHQDRERHSPSPFPSDNSGRSSSPSPYPPAQPRHYPSRHHTPASSSPGSSLYAFSRPPSATESPGSYLVEDLRQMHIQDLLWVPSVAKFHDEFMQMKERINQLLDQEKHLFERSRKADILLDQVQQLQVQLAQHGSSASTNTQRYTQHISNALPPVPRDSCTKFGNPAQLPSGFHPAVLWTLEDSKSDPMTSYSTSNASRPGMATCIRHPLTGELVSPSEYRAICIAARTVAEDLINQIMTTRTTNEVFKATKTHIIANHPDEWTQAILQLEHQQPILTFCADHWKASHVLMGALQNIKPPALSQEPVPPRHKRSRSSASPDRPDPPQHDESVGTAAHTPARSQNSMTKTFSPRPVSKNKLLQGSNKGKGKAVAMPADARERQNEQRSPSTAAAHFQGPSSSMVYDEQQLPSPAAEGVLPPQNEPCSLFGTAAKFDVRFISMDATYENLKRIVISEYPSNKVAVQLLDSLHRNSAFGGGAPSANVIQLIDRIENADPNDPGLEEDDLGPQWGHAQYKGWSTCLCTWQDIGTPEIAFSLIAAFIKTSKVARYLCQQDNINIEGKSILSDSYVAELTERLWELWQNSNTNPSMPSTSISGSQPTSTFLVLKKELEALTVSALRKFTIDHNLGFKEKAAKKEVVVSFISSVLETNPTLNDAMRQLIDASKKVSRNSVVSK